MVHERAFLCSVWSLFCPTYSMTLKMINYTFLFSCHLSILLIALLLAQKACHYSAKVFTLIFAECPTLRKRCSINHGYSVSFIQLSVNKSDNLFIFFCFSSIVGWTYLFNVIFTEECPNISLKLFMSKPSSIHRVANVCRSA